jgi:DNA-binding MarR family transcriptional regulator
MAVTRSPLGITAVPDTVLTDSRIGPFAFRLLVLLHSERLEENTDEADLARTIGYTPQTLLGALRNLEAAGYVIRRIPGDWQVTPWA